MVQEAKDRPKSWLLLNGKEVDDILSEYIEKAKWDKATSIAKKSLNNRIRKTVRYVKMFTLDNLEAKTIDGLLDKSVNNEATIVTDGSRSHINIKNNFAEHISVVEYDVANVVKKDLPWVHIVIGECRNGIAAIHKETDGRFLQLYLNKYCWKFNRRFFRDSTDPKYDLFDRLVKIATQYTSNLKWRDYHDGNDEDSDNL